MYRIKQVPEDFIVKEISAVRPLEAGDYGLFRLVKRDCTTLKACQWISASLKVPLKNIGFAGIKDRQAVTEQLLSIKCAGKGAERVSNRIMRLEYLGRSKSPVSLGDLEGNSFEITIRDVLSAPECIGEVINYFDDQRFSRNNHLVGKAIIKRDFRLACDLLESEPQIRAHLDNDSKDFVGAIKSLPLRMRRIYVHAYQSWLFNRMVSGYLADRPHRTAMYSLGEMVFPEDGTEDIKIPLIGFGTPDCADEIGVIMERVMSEEGISERDFVIKELPELSVEGDLRDLVVRVRDLRIGDLEEDDLNKGKKKVVVKFSLQKGSYATVAVRRMML